MTARRRGLAHYRRTPGPGECVTLTFKLPHHPVAAGETKYLDAVAAADYVLSLENVDYWTSAPDPYCVIHTPGEPLMEEAHRARPST